MPRPRGRPTGSKGPTKKTMAIIQDSILRQRGLKRGTKGTGLLEPNTLGAPDIEGRKTLSMRLLERTFDTPIEILLAVDIPYQTVMQKLGIKQATVFAWRKRLGLECNSEVTVTGPVPSVEAPGTTRTGF